LTQTRSFFRNGMNKAMNQGLEAKEASCHISLVGMISTLRNAALAHTTSGTNAGTVTRIEEYQPGKALWDWLPLLGILAIPVVVGWFTFQQGRASDAKRKQQHETDLKIAADQQKEGALQAHLDSMSGSILEKNLLRKDASILELEGADLSKTNLSHANLRGANLREAILSSSNATMEQLAQAESLQGATMPDGAKHP
jgi:hypothetical protein